MSKSAESVLRGLKEVRDYMRGDDTPGVKIHIPEEIDAAAIRKVSGLSQEKFAKRIGVAPSTLKQWEQGRRVPTGPAKVLLAMLAKNPRVVEETLSAA